MSNPDKFKYTLDQPLAELIPTRMLAPKQDTYTDPQYFKDEIAKVFDSDWVMMGRSGSIPKPGDYFTAQLGQRPIIIVRQKDGSISAFGNYCLHRYTQLLKGCGSTKRIVCPYHYWAYELDGELIGVTDKEGFCSQDINNQRLETLTCDEHFGYIFVSMRDDLAPVSKRLENLSSIFENFKLDRYHDVHVEHEEVWQANWKFVYQNFIESYHTTYTHKKSIGPANPTKLVEYGPLGDPHFTIHSNSYTEAYLPDIYNENLEEHERRRFYVSGVFPNGLIAIEPNFVWWMVLEPIAENRTNSRWGVSFAPDAIAKLDKPDEFVDEIVQLIKVAMSEDKEMVEGMQVGANFNSDKPGVLHAPLEVHIKEFEDYLQKKKTE